MSTNELKTELENSITTSINSHWRFCLFEGAILIMLGLAAFVIPRTTFVEFQFGWLFLLSGITGLIITLWVRDAPGFWWSIISAILAIAAGSLMLFSPTEMLSLTLILILFFVIEGVASIMYGLSHKRSQSGQWVWMLGNGIIDLFLTALILIGLPGSAKWALGLLIGVNLISGGAALIGIALQGRATVSHNAT